MSSKLIKTGGSLEIVGDEIVASIRILKSGQIQLEAPTVSPMQLCKMLNNLIFDVMYASLQPAEAQRIQPPTM